MVLGLTLWAALILFAIVVSVYQEIKERREMREQAFEDYKEMLRWIEEMNDHDL